MIENQMGSNAGRKAPVVTNSIKSASSKADSIVGANGNRVLSSMDQGSGIIDTIQKYNYMKDEQNKAYMDKMKERRAKRWTEDEGLN